MVLKIVGAHDLKSGSSVMIDGIACTVRGVDISKTGKHGASKVRFEAIGVIDGKKRVVTVPGHEKFEVPLIEKKRGQVLSVGEKANMMDSESFETFDVDIAEELKSEVKEGVQVEYWDVEGAKVIKRVVG